MTTRTQIIEALKAARRWHYSCEDAWYSCPKSEGGCANEYAGTECSCGADKTNASIDAAIAELEKQPAEQVAVMNDRERLTPMICAFWRRIYPYRNDYGKELPMPLPIAFVSSMATAMYALPASTAKEVPADDYAAHYERKWHAVSAECADLQDQLNAANTKIVQIELASRQSPADVLAVLDELEKLVPIAHWERCQAKRDYKLDCECFAGEHNTKVRTLTAKLRSLLGGEV